MRINLTMRTLLTLSLALALPACVVPKIVGDNNAETDEDDDGDGSESTDSASDADTGKGTTTQGDPDVTTDAPDATTGEPGSTTEEENTTSKTPVDCEDLTVDECESLPECMPAFGAAEEFPGCLPGLQYLGCLPQMACDSVILTVCEEITGNAFRLTDGCIPEGFAPCEGAGSQCGSGQACEDLGEQACADAGCTQVFGAPHVDQEGTICADYDAQEFLGCLPPDTTCPPFIPVVCPAGMDAPAWDVPSGCANLPNFDQCEDQVVPACE
jgi:hypothetical protein